MNMQNRKVEVQRDKVVITEAKEIGFRDDKGIEGLKRKLKTELGDIVRSVKSLKERAEEIKAILGEIESQTEKETEPVKSPA